MKHNEILDEIYRAREHIVSEAGDDSQRLLAWVRAEEAKARASGTQFAPLPEPVQESCILREDPPKPSV